MLPQHSSYRTHLKNIQIVHFLRVSLLTWKRKLLSVCRRTPLSLSGNYQQAISNISFEWLLTAVLSLRYPKIAKKIVAVSGEGVIIWDTISAEPIRTLPLEMPMAFSVEFSRDSSRVEFGSVKCTLDLWDLDNDDLESVSLEGYVEIPIALFAPLTFGPSPPCHWMLL